MLDLHQDEASINIGEDDTGWGDFFMPTALNGSKRL